MSVFINLVHQAEFLITGRVLIGGESRQVVMLAQYTEAFNAVTDLK